jgi:hypothetical protein
MQIIENRQDRLQTLIDKFNHQADSFILHKKHADIPEISAIKDYSQYDNIDLIDDPSSEAAEPVGRSAYRPPQTSADGSGMDHLDPEDLPILLPSTLGLEWCVTHGAEHLAAKEAQLRMAQANESIHSIRLALGIKSALFRTQVRSANSQQKKTRAQKNIKSVNTAIHEYARIYSMARDAFQVIRHALAAGPKLPPLLPKDLHVATLVLGSDQTGQRNKQQSWIWSFGETSEDDGTWMENCKWLHCCVSLC